VSVKFYPNCTEIESEPYSGGCVLSGFQTAPRCRRHTPWTAWQHFSPRSVRAPLTGIALTIEMTGSANLLLPMLAACFGAMVVTNLIGTRPIYDLLRERAKHRMPPAT